nr:MAG TPA: Nuclease [Caudoviricetes sp.]
MKEKLMEQKLTKAAKHIGGIAIKIVSPGFDGMPDRMVLLPEGRMGFVEVKQPGKVPRPLQAARHRMLRRLGFKVCVLDDAEQIKTILTEIGGDAR